MEDQLLRDALKSIKDDSSYMRGRIDTLHDTIDDRFEKQGARISKTENKISHIKGKIALFTGGFTVFSGVIRDWIKNLI